MKVAHMAHNRRKGASNRASDVKRRYQSYFIGKAVLCLILAAAFSSVSLLCLSPVYGSIPSSLYHSQATVAVLSIGVIIKAIAPQYVPRDVRFWLPILAFWIPTQQFASFKRSSHLGPIIGPILTESLTVLPLLLLSTFVNLELSNLLTAQASHPVNLLHGIVALSVFLSTKNLSIWFVRHLAGYFPWIISSPLQHVLAFIYASLFPSKLLLLAIPSILHSIYFNVHMPFPPTTHFLNYSLQSNLNWTVIARQESVTGYISVLENSEMQLRVLRCDHSLLGGEWFPPSDREHRSKVREPIYAVFAMLEAVRLVEMNSVKHAEQRSINSGAQKNALMM